MTDASKATNVADLIYVDLLEQILSDQLEPGARLLSERALAQRYASNRNTLREAIRKLEHARLVSVRHGQGVTVRDFRQDGTVDCLGPFLLYAATPAERVRVIIDLLTARAQVLQMSIALAAARAEPGDIERISQLTDRQLDNYARSDTAGLIATDVELINALVDAAHSLTARWIANTLLEVYRGLMALTPGLWVADASYPDYLRDLRIAISARQADTAVQLTRQYYDLVDAVLVGLLRTLTPSAP